MFDAQTQSKLQIWRQKAIDGTLSEAEMIEAVTLLRQGRMSAATASEKSKVARTAKAGPALPSGDDLLDEMMG